MELCINQMNKLVSIFACILIYGLGFLHGNSSDSKLIGYIVCGIIGYFVGTAIYQYFKRVWQVHEQET